MWFCVVPRRPSFRSFQYRHAMVGAHLGSPWRSFKIHPIGIVLNLRAHISESLLPHARQRPGPSSKLARMPMYPLPTAKMVSFFICAAAGSVRPRPRPSKGSHYLLLFWAQHAFAFQWTLGVSVLFACIALSSTCSWSTVLFGTFCIFYQNESSCALVTCLINTATCIFKLTDLNCYAHCNCQSCPAFVSGAWDPRNFWRF